MAAVALISMMLFVGFEMLAPYFYKVFFDTITSSKGYSASASVLLKIIIIIAVCNLSRILFRRLGDYINIPLYSRVMSNIYHECFEYLHKHSYNFFNNNFAGSLVKRVNRMVNAFEVISDKFYYELIPLVLRIIIIFSVLLWIRPIIGLIMLIWTAFFMISNYFFTLYKWKFDILRAEADTEVTGVLADTITNNANVKMFASLGFELKNFRIVINDWAEKLSFTWKMDFIASTMQALAMAILEFLVFYFAIDYWTKGMLTPGDFVLMQAYLLELFGGLWNFSRIVRDLYARFADADEMMEILNQKHEVSDFPHAKEISVIRGQIEFKDVVFSYHDEGSVIKDMNLTIKSGEKVALIGPSGGGKSTITKLLLRFFDIKKGKILIDGQDIKKVTQDSLRSQISFVPQDPILFHRTLMENIRYGRHDASDEEVIAAAKLANCHDFIMGFSDKYNTYVGERGIKLSGGERQRVAIARAILTNAPILILDEATSSLDSESEMLIQQALQNLMKQKTTIVIAHRLSTIMKMDRILVLQEGRIVEEGSHSDLISQESGLYKRLWDLQVGGYVEK
jgi:ATP-binding cassette subfamily B protein